MPSVGKMRGITKRWRAASEELGIWTGEGRGIGQRASKGCRMGHSERGLFNVVWVSMWMRMPLGLV